MAELLKNFLATAIILWAAIILMAALIALSWWLSRTGNNLQVQLPVLAISGVVILLAMLALVSVFFAIFELDDKTQALALPEGSIRAVIALSLIVLFAILTVYLYGSLIGVGNAATPATDFAKQLLVLVGTLVTAVASFYFGSKAAPSVSPAAAAAPEIRGIDPTHHAAGAGFQLTVNGDRLDLVKEVKIVSGSNQVVATDVVSNASTVKCNITLPQNATGAWDVIATDGLGRTARLPSALTVSP